MNLSAVRRALDAQGPEARAAVQREGRLRRDMQSLLHLFESDDVTGVDHAVALLVKYMLGPRPLLELPRDEWVQMFRRVGYQEDGVVDEGRRPTEPFVAYRAAADGYERGLSWTTDRAFAELFRAENQDEYEQDTCQIWRCKIRPEWILASGIHSHGREWIVDVPEHAAVVVDGDTQNDRWTVAGGQRRWGAAGAAGVLFVHSGRVLLQMRSWRVDHPNTYSIPGGALRPGESPLDGALREASEECAVDPADVQVIGEHVQTHGTWSYTTLLCAVEERFTARSSREALAHLWVPISGVAQLHRYLHPDFRNSWPELKGLLP